MQAERNENARPEFTGSIDNIDKYDTIFLGYPIWYGDMPAIMNTFLETYNLSGKTIISFSTNGGSGWGSSITTLKNILPNSEFVNGFSVSGAQARSSEEAVKNWLSGLDIEHDNAGGFDFETKSVMLNNGIEMPILGIGTFTLSDSQAENSVYWALKDGYRLIDTARIYGNETGVGRGIKRAIDEGISHKRRNICYNKNVDL